MNRDSETTIRQLKIMVQKFCEDRDWDKYHNAKDLAIGISTEASELLEHFRFKSDSEIENIFKSRRLREELSNELSDVFFFVLRMSQRYGIDLSSSLHRKMVENEQKYPIFKARGSNKKYTEL